MSQRNDPKNLLVPAMILSRADEDAFDSLWHVGGEAADYPLWDFVVQCTLKQDQHFRFKIDFLQGLAVELNRRYERLNPTQQEKEKKIFFQEKPVWVYEDGNYEIRKMCNIQFLLQNVYMYNLKKLFTAPFGDVKQAKGYKEFCKFFDGLSDNTFSEDFQKIIKMLSHLSSHQEDIKTLDIKKLKLSTSIKPNYEIALPKVNKEIALPKVNEPNIFQRAWNAIKNFAKEHPLLTGFIIFAVLSALAIGITIATMGSGAFAGAFLVGLTAAHLPGVAAAFSSIAVISTALAAVVDAAIILTSAYIMYGIGAGIYKLGSFLFGKKEPEPVSKPEPEPEPESASEPIKTRARSKSLGSNTEVNEKDFPPRDELTRVLSAKELKTTNEKPADPKEKEARPRAKSLSATDSVSAIGVFTPGKEKTKEVKKTDGDSEGVGLKKH